MKHIFRIVLIIFILKISIFGSKALVTSSDASLTYSDFSLDLSSSFSIQSWTKAYDSTNYYGWTWMIGGVQLGIGNVNGTMQGLVDNSSVNPSSGSVSYNTWVHNVLTYSSSTNTYTFYQNGIAYSFSGTPNLGLQSTLTIGGKSGNEQLNGEIDEVVVWNKSLTQAEVTSLYNSGSGVSASTSSGNYTSSSNIVMYLKFEDSLNSEVGSFASPSSVGTAPSYVISSIAVPLDTTPPTLSNITLSGTPESSATSVTFVASFSESVVNVDTTDFELTTTGTATGVISSVSSSSGTSINVIVDSISGIGTLRVDLKTSHDITDSASNALSGGYSSGSLHSVDFSPAVPQFLTVTALNDTQMYVNWDDNSTNEDNFNLYSSNDGTNFELNGTFGADITSTTVMNLNAETTYYFRVGVINGYGENNTSNESNTTLAYVAPVPIQAGGNTNSTQVELSWSNNSIIETGYKIYTNGGNKITVGKNITSKIMTGLAPDTTYNFRIDTYIHIPIIFTSGIDIVIGTQNATLKTNDPAEFTFLTNQTKNEDFDEFNLTISNIVDNDSDNITLSVESNDSSILTLTPSWTNNLTQADYNDTNFTIGVLAVSNANGVVEVNLSSYDGKDYVINTFNIAVNGVDDNATVTPIENLYRDINFSEFNVSFSVDDVDFNELNITVDVNDTSLVDINQTWINDLDYAEYNSTELNLTIKSKPNVEGVVRFTISQRIINQHQLQYLI